MDLRPETSNRWQQTLQKDGLPVTLKSWKVPKEEKSDRLLARIVLKTDEANGLVSKERKWDRCPPGLGPGGKDILPSGMWNKSSGEWGTDVEKALQDAQVTATEHTHPGGEQCDFPNTDQPLQTTKRMQNGTSARDSPTWLTSVLRSSWGHVTWGVFNAKQLRFFQKVSSTVGVSLKASPDFVILSSFNTAWDRGEPKGQGLHFYQVGKSFSSVTLCLWKLEVLLALDSKAHE